METVTYLAAHYWPYALGVLLIGAAAGWFSHSVKK